jgi:anti-sigma factor RsiW
MHKPVKERLEAYLRGSKQVGAFADFHSHMEGCEGCRQEVQAMETQAGLLRLLAASEEIEPLAGFYGRAMQAIEARRSASVWFAFLDPDFGRRLMFASLAIVFVLSSYLVLSEQGASFAEYSPVSFMAADPGSHHVGADPQQDRETVLLSLASYQE